MKKIKKNVVSIRQPIYLPWIPFFQQIALSDTHVFSDTAQMSNTDKAVRRNKIKGTNGLITLSVPVVHKGRYQTLEEVEIDNTQNWEKKHLEALRHSYSKAFFFDEYFPFFQETYKREWNKLIDLNTHIICWLSEQFDIDAKFIRASDLGRIPKKSTELLVNICQEVEATAYLSGPKGKDYMDERLFAEHGIELSYRSEKHPTYAQIGRGPFLYNMSVVDLLFNCGPKSRSLINLEDISTS